ncbi:CsbD-like protein [compost metagenome]
MNKNQVKGRVKEIEGTIKEVAGKAVGNKRLEERGKIEKTVGTIQAGLGDLKEDLKH